MDKEPPRLWYSVETPSVFEEYELPARSEDFSAEEDRQWGRLKWLAELHGTHITPSTYQRG